MARVKAKAEELEAAQAAQGAAQDAPEAAGGTTTAQTADGQQGAAETPQDAPGAAAGEDTTTAADGQQNAPQAPAEEPDAADVVKLVYVGPQLPRGRLKTNTIFEGTREQILAAPELAAVLEQYPLVKNMLAPVSKLAEAKLKIKTAGNALHKFYADIDSLIAAKGMEG